MDEDVVLTVLAEVDDEVLLGAELAHEVLRGDHADGALLRLDLFCAFHGYFVRNYSALRRRGISNVTIGSRPCGNVRESDLGQNQI